MARGQVSKQEIFAKMLETFNGSFMNGEKELRIPMNEDGNPVQIKVTLTAAKDWIPLPGEKVEGEEFEEITPEHLDIFEPTEEEVATVHNLLQQLNM